MSLPTENQVWPFDIGGDIIKIGPAFEGAVGAYRLNITRIIYIGLQHLADPPEPPELEVNQAVQGYHLPERERPGALVRIPAQVAVKNLDLSQDVGQPAALDIAVSAGGFTGAGIIERKDYGEIIAERRKNQAMQQANDIPDAVRRLTGRDIALPVVDPVVKPVKVGILRLVGITISEAGRGIFSLPHPLFLVWRDSLPPLVISSKPGEITNKIALKTPIYSSAVRAKRVISRLYLADPSAVSDKGDLQPRIPGSNSFFKLPVYKSLCSNCQRIGLSGGFP